MAKREREIDNLRREVKKRVQAVNRKIKRYENLGVDIGQSEFDPRRKDARIDRYRTSDLLKYRDELNGFMSRRNQFVPDSQNRPIPRFEWSNYKRLERRANKIADSNYDQIKDIFVPESGMTIAERREMFGEQKDPVVNTPFTRVEREPDYVTSRRNLAKLTAQMSKKIKPAFMKDFVANGRAQLDQMLEKANRPDIAEAAKTLSDKQFHILWGWTGFADSVYLDYASAEGGGGYQNQKVADQQAGTALDMIEWVKGLDPNNPNPNQSPKPMTFEEKRKAMNSRKNRKK